MRKYLIALWLVFSSTPAFAACVASGANWVSTPDYASVNSCYSQADSGDTITISAGSESWGSSSLTISKSLTLIGATSCTGSGATLTCTDNSTISGTGTITVSSNGDLAVDISGLSLSGMGFYVVNASTSTPLTNMRIHHNHVSNASVGLQVGHSGGGGLVFGLFDHNRLDNNNYGFIWRGTNSSMWGSHPGSTNMGSENFVYIEDNHIAGSTATVMASSGVGARWVYRYNYANVTGGAGQQMMLDAHGDTANRGIVAFEAYENTFTGSSSKGIDFRGGTGIVFNNSWAGAAGTYTGWITVREEYPECTNSGGCPDTVTLVGTCADEVNNGYIWNNHKTSTADRVEVTEEDCLPCAYPYQATSINCLTAQINYWSDTAGASPTSYFSTGAASSRPASASTNGDVYWTTDTRILYRAVTGTTWAQVYTPYYYPHPLTLTGGDTTAPVIDNLSPTGSLACTSNPRNVVLSLTTDEVATARMTTVSSDIAYADMTDTFTTTGSTSHSETKSLACGTSYNYWVRTIDASDNVNTSSGLISFSIASPQIAGPGGLRTSGGIKYGH